MEWIVGGCLVALVLILNSVITAVGHLKDLHVSTENARLEATKNAQEIVYELAGIRNDISTIEKSLSRLSDRYAPRESDVDRFEREMMTK